MATLTIGFNTEYYGIDTFDVFVSLCEPTNWQLVANDITYENFPLTINLADYGISQVNCFQYYVSGNTGCYFTRVVDATIGTICPSPTPTPSVTPSNTPTITPSSTVTPTNTMTATATPTSSITSTPTVTPTVTPTSSPICFEYLLNTPGSPNTTNSVWNFTRCDGQQVIGLSVSPATSTNMCIIPGTLVLVSGPGQSTQLGNCST